MLVDVTWDCVWLFRPVYKCSLTVDGCYCDGGSLQWLSGFSGCWEIGCEEEGGEEERGGGGGRGEEGRGGGRGEGGGRGGGGGGGGGGGRGEGGGGGRGRRRRGRREGRRWREEGRGRRGRRCAKGVEIQTLRDTRGFIGIEYIFQTTGFSGFLGFEVGNYEDVRQW